MSPQDPQSAALLAHVVSQIEQNVNFLASQNYISQSDASAILTKLPNANAGSINQITSRMANLMPTPSTMPTPSIVTAPRAVPQPTASLSQAKALWAYNEHGQDPEDLSFSVGDVIEIVEETNADWWTGRFNGNQGLFPSTYVERVQAPINVGRSTKPYKPFGAAYQGMTAPPPPGQGTNDVGLQEKAGTEEKKDKFGKYKSTLAHSAVGGVGFGAGSAIGGGLVRAIF